MKKTVPRLDVTAFKNIRTMMKHDKDLSSLVKNTPVLKNVLQLTEANVRRYAEKDTQFLLLRTTHLQVIQSILLLLQKDPDSLVVLESQPRRTWEMTCGRDDQQHLFYTIEIYHDKKIQQEMSFWSSNDLVRHLVEAFVKTAPRRISVFRSPLSMKSVPIHIFLRKVNDFYQPVTVPIRLKNLYTQHYYHLS